MKQKHLGMICLGVLAVCIPTVYAAVLVGMAQAFGYGDWNELYLQLFCCSLLVGLGIYAIYRGLKGRKITHVDSN